MENVTADGLIKKLELRPGTGSVVPEKSIVSGLYQTSDFDESNLLYNSKGSLLCSVG